MVEPIEDRRITQTAYFARGAEKAGGLGPGWRRGELTAGGMLFLGLEELAQGLYGYLELGAAGLGGGEVSLEEVADSDGWAHLAEDIPGLGDEDELQDGVAPPGDKGVEQGGEDDVAQDVRAAARVDAAALARPFERHLPLPLVGSDGLVLGPVVAPDGSELHRREKEEQHGQDRELRKEREDTAERARAAPKLHEAHEQPQPGERRGEEGQNPEGADDLQEEPAPEKDRAHYRQTRDALDGRVLGLLYV